jgi:hypothetical protein
VNIDLLESNKNENKEEIRRLTQEGKDLRGKLAQLQKVGIYLFIQSVCDLFLRTSLSCPL